ncbi:SHOCT domain-containing protein [Candidatus Bipolaricaulota bacterium]|nr:SHOCT domain-containing protein [Candidatus Bipolaricaulota bacterium]
MGSFGMWGAGGGIIMILFWALIGLVLVFLVKELTDGGEKKNATRLAESRGDALKILDERFARGEIEQEEYRRRKKEITR